MTAGCEVMVPSAAFLGLPVTPLLATPPLSGPSAAPLWAPPPPAGVVAARNIEEGVTSLPLSADDIIALRCDAHSFVTDDHSAAKMVSRQQRGTPVT